MRRIDKWKKVFKNHQFDLLDYYEEYLYLDEDVEIDFENDFIVLSVDISEGLKQDYSIIQILRLEFDEQTHDIYYRQIGLFRSNEIGIEEFADVVAELFDNFNEDRTKLLVEQNTFGDLLFKCIQINEEFEVPMESILKFKRNADDKKLIKGLRVNTQSRIVAVKAFKTLMDKNKIIIRESKTCEEVENFQKNSKGKYEASIGHDDTVTALTNFSYFIQLADTQLINWLEDFYEYIGYEFNDEDARAAARTQSMTEKEFDDIDESKLDNLDSDVAEYAKQMLGI